LKEEREAAADGGSGSDDEDSDSDSGEDEETIANNKKLAEVKAELERIEKLDDKLDEMNERLGGEKADPEAKKRQKVGETKESAYRIWTFCLQNVPDEYDFVI
jgi:hypothetical protein